MPKKKLFKLRYFLPICFGLVFFLLTILGNDIWAAFGSFRGVKTLEPEQVTMLLETDGAMLIDVRKKEEFEVSHLKGAVLAEDLDLSSVDPSRPLLLYCTIGFRSTELGATLSEKGFRNIYNLNGGIIRWKNEGRPVFNQDHQPTDSVHVYSDLFGFLLRDGQAVE